MTIVNEINIENFEPWNGGEYLYDRIVNEGKLGAFEAILDDLFIDREYITGTELNDMLRFETDEICHWLGMKTEDEIEDEREEREERREAIRRLAETQSADEFCGIWSNELDMDCTLCPLYRERNCEDDAAVWRNRNEIQETVDDMLKELEEEDE